MARGKASGVSPFWQRVFELAPPGASCAAARPAAAAVSPLRATGGPARAGAPLPGSGPGKGPRRPGKSGVRMDPPRVVKPRWHPDDERACLVVFDGLRTANEGNARGFSVAAKWGAGGRISVARLAARAGTAAFLAEWGGTPPAAPYVVTLTRVAPSQGLDCDGIPSALKAVRDGVADALGTGDGPKSPVTWRYEQRRGSWGVEVRIEWGGGS